MECEVCVNGTRLEHVSEFKYLGCVLEESSRDEEGCRRNLANGRRAAGVIRSLVNARGLRLQCTRVVRESLLVPVVMCGSKDNDMEGENEA